MADNAKTTNNVKLSEEDIETKKFQAEDLGFKLKAHEAQIAIWKEQLKAQFPLKQLETQIKAVEQECRNIKATQKVLQRQIKTGKA